LCTGRRCCERSQRVGGACSGTAQRTNGRCPVGCGDAGTHAAVIDADGERGAVTLGVLIDHERQFELIGALVRHRRADDSAAVPQEERHLRSTYQRGRGDQITLVLPLAVIGTTTIRPAARARTAALARPRLPAAAGRISVLVRPPCAPDAVKHWWRVVLFPGRGRGFHPYKYLLAHKATLRERTAPQILPGESLCPSAE